MGSSTMRRAIRISPQTSLSPCQSQRQPRHRQTRAKTWKLIIATTTKTKAIVTPLRTSRSSVVPPVGSARQPPSNPAPTPAPTPDTCEDVELDHCAYYKSKGYCETVENIKKQCRSTCGLCPKADATGKGNGKQCVDKELYHCAFYKSKGYCQTVENVKKQCQKTCQLC